MALSLVSEEQRQLRTSMSIAHQESLKICKVCGEIFDANIEVEAIHHRQGEHAPLLPPRSKGRRPPVMVARAA